METTWSPDWFTWVTRRFGASLTSTKSVLVGLNICHFAGFDALILKESHCPWSVLSVFSPSDLEVNSLHTTSFSFCVFFPLIVHLERNLAPSHQSTTAASSLSTANMAEGCVAQICVHA